MRASWKPMPAAGQDRTCYADSGVNWRVVEEYGEANQMGGNSWEEPGRKGPVRTKPNGSSAPANRGAGALRFHAS